MELYTRATLGVLLAPLVAPGQSRSAEPLKVSVCDIAQSVEQFNGKMITVRGVVRLAFEDFELPATDCGTASVPGIWLEYGRGPRWQPTTWCCGALTPRDRLRLVQDSEFRTFHRYLTAQGHGQGCYLGECLTYVVTATLTGRVDAAKPEAGPAGTGLNCSGAYGHMGFACARIVIARVSDVLAERASVKPPK